MHLISLCIPFYSHLKSQKSLLESFLDAGHQVTIMTHARLGPLVGQIGAEFCEVDWMDSFLDNPAVQQANGLAYTGAMLYEMAHRIDEMTEEVHRLQPDGIIFDSATRWGKVIALRIGVPMLARSAMYPPLYQYNRTHTIKRQLLYDAIRAPKSFVHIGQAITKLIFEQKPKDYDELYSRIFNDNDIKTCTAIPSCLFDSHTLAQLHMYEHHGLRVDEYTEYDTTWDRVTQETRPIIYVSLGTLITIDDDILQTLERASMNQILFIVSSGPQGNQGSTENVVWQSFVPQKQLLDACMLCITHAGANTVIECIARSIPMVCVPFLTDQWMYAYRIIQLGIGTLNQQSILTNHQQLHSVLSQMIIAYDTYKHNYEKIDVYEHTESYGSLVDWFEKEHLR